MIHLRSIRIQIPETGFPEEFPFQVPAIKTLGELEFLSPVTLFVGENGSGKSTLMEYKDRSETARAYAKMPYLGQLEEMHRRYGDGLDSHSHGESFLALFQSRFVPGGLYLLDEPEPPLYTASIFPPSNKSSTINWSMYH
jgi:predicted ATPase